MSVPLWAALFAMSAWIFLRDIHTVVLEDGRIELISYLRRVRLSSGEVHFVEETRAGPDSSIEIHSSAAESYAIPIRGFEKWKELAQELRHLSAQQSSQLVESALVGSRRFGHKRISSATVGFCCVLALSGMIALFGTTAGAKFCGIAMITLAILLALLSLGSKELAVTVSQQGIRMKGLFSEKSASWSDITLVRLTSPTIQYSMWEVLEIHHSGKTLFIGGYRDDFGLLREVVLSRVPPELVVDKRS
jgi:hypothetical protein